MNIRKLPASKLIKGKGIELFLKKGGFTTMLKFTVCMMFLVLTVNIAFAGPEGGVIIAPKIDAKITIDGKLDEWKLNLFKEDQKIVLTKKNGFINAGGIDDDKDFSAVIYALYDNDNLYLAVQVTDDASEKGFAAGSNWQNDCIEIWIDGAGDDGTMTDRGGNDPDNYQLNVDINGVPFVYRNDDAGKILPQIESAASTQGTNYTLEVMVPFSAIPELDLKSKIMGFSISFVDSDKGVWNHILWQGEVEHEPTTWGDLMFASEKLAVEPAEKMPVAWGMLKNGDVKLK